MIIPPYMLADRPILAGPLLVGQLEQAGYEAKCLDLNVEFFNHILNSNYLKSLKEELIEIQNREIPQKQRVLISAVLNNKIDFVIKYIDEAVEVYHNENFYNPELLSRAMKVLSVAFDSISARTWPYRISFSPDNKFLDLLNLEQIEVESEDYDNNIFYRFYSEIIKNVIPEDINFIGISVPNKQNIAPAFTLAKYLKKRYKAKICVGGSTITRCSELLKNSKELFKNYFDFVLLGDGEKSIVQLVEYIEGKRKKDDVSGLIALNENNNIFHTEIEYIKSFDGVAMPSFVGIDFKKYFAPDIVIPMMASKGCYWGKCTFCDFAYGTKYFGEISVDKLISMIKYVKEKYGISFFEFMDESVPPLFLKKFATAILENNIKISYAALVRTDELFTAEILELLYLSGCKMLNWGYESHSKRIIKLMNKGVDNVDRPKLLELSSKAGIWNHAFFLFDFPSETEEEWLLTKNFILNNDNIIDSFGTNSFRLEKYALIRKQIEKSSDIVSYKDHDFSTSLTNINKELEERRNENINQIRKDIYKQKGYALWNILMPDIYLFLYLAQKGKENVKKTVLIPANKI